LLLLFLLRLLARAFVVKERNPSPSGIDGVHRHYCGCCEV
jgi:hypothetical protein